MNSKKQEINRPLWLFAATKKARPNRRKRWPRYAALREKRMQRGVRQPNQSITITWAMMTRRNIQSG